MGLQRGQSDEKYMAHKAFYEGCEGEVDLLILENVCEYNMEAIVRQELPTGWACKAFRIDPRLFGFGTARPRVYGLAWKSSKFELSKEFSFMDVLDGLQATPRMTAKDYFFLTKQPTKLSESDVSQLSSCVTIFLQPPVSIRCSLSHILQNILYTSSGIELAALHGPEHVCQSEGVGGGRSGPASAQWACPDQLGGWKPDDFDHKFVEAVWEG